MEYWEVKNFKDDLQKLADLIEQYNVPCEITDIYSLIGNFYNLNHFNYQLLNIGFNINKKIAGSYPDMDEYKIFLTNTIETLEPKNVDVDCIQEYVFELNIDGNYLDEKGEIKTLRSCWHLDKHVESADGTDGIPKFTHPSYHFQFGGDYITGRDTGELGILANPRLPHPPMDIFLGFNFVINNFFNRGDYEFVNKILSDYDYHVIIKRAQERCWDSYFRGFDSSSNHKDFTMTKIFPMYII